MEEAPKNGRRQWLIGALATVGGGAGVGELVRQQSAGSLPTPGEDAAVAHPTLPASAFAQAAPRGTEDMLISPFDVGRSLARWRVRAVTPLIDGSASLLMTDEHGLDFQLDIYARDFSASALRPPGQSEHFDVFLANGGTGDSASLEEHGLAAMAVADVLRQNEALLDTRQFVTLRQRLAAAPGGIRRSV